MKRKTIIAITLMMAIFLIYFVFFRKDKNLYYVPKEADFVALVDVKNVGKTYLYEFLTHPSEWFAKPTDRKGISLQNSGVKMPDYIQLFHVKNTPISEWYSIFEIKNQEKFQAFLKQEKFTKQANNFYRNESFSVCLIKDRCIFSTLKNDNQNFQNLTKLLPENNSFYTANQFLENAHGSFSIIAEGEITNLPIFIKDNSIVLENQKENKNFEALISKIKETPLDFLAELDDKNSQKLLNTYQEKLADSIKINKISAAGNLEMVNDTIISYGFDDNFNEVKKVSYQNILQPNYKISLEAKNTDFIWKKFAEKKYINAKNEFTAIPFLPNNISKTFDKIDIVSTRKKISKSNLLNKNFIFYKNNPQVIHSLKSLSYNEKKLLSNIDYLFYGNENKTYYIEIMFKKEKLPLILRKY